MKLDKLELIDWLSTLSGLVFLAIRVGGVSPLGFVVGSAFCIIEGAADLYLYFKQSKEKRKLARLFYSAFIILASVQGVIMLYMRM